jgi:hypothetical protein
MPDLNEEIQIPGAFGLRNASGDLQFSQAAFLEWELNRRWTAREFRGFLRSLHTATTLIQVGDFVSSS